MDVVINKCRLSGNVTVPMSKSMAHRYLILGAMTEKSEIIGVPECDDIERTLDCLYGMGADIEKKADRVVIGGLYENTVRNKKLYVGESGSTLRFIMPVASDMGEFSFHTCIGLSKRPVEEYGSIIPIRKNGEVITVGKTEFTGNYSVSSDRSSQFLSGLLLLCGKYGGTVTADGEIHSKPYVDMTLSALRKFGCICEEKHGKYTVSGGLKNSTVYNEGDFSSAAVYFLLNKMGADIHISGLCENSLQGDGKISEMLSDDIWDVDDTPDLSPYLMAFAAYKGKGKLIHTHRLRYKESPRDLCMAKELRKFGAAVKVSYDETEIVCENLKKPDTPLFCHEDHRIAMALAALCTVTGGVLTGAECVSKSYPDFISHMISLGMV